MAARLDRRAKKHAVILIGLAGPYGVGKRTIAMYLHAQYGFDRVLFYQNIGHALRKSNAPGIAFDDVFFDYEATAIRAAGGQIWLVQRPNYLTRAGDPWQGITTADPDRGIVNDGSIEALYRRADTLLAAFHLDQARAKAAT